MKKLLGIMVLGFLLSGNAYSGSHSTGFSKIKGDLKIKCITTDKSKISTIEVKFDGTENPPTFLDKNKAVLVYGPPDSESYVVVWDDIVTANIIFTSTLKFDSTLMIGEISHATRKSLKEFSTDIISAPIECIKLIDTREGVESGEEKSRSSGTAFFVSNKGYLLTNNHVVKGCSLSKISYFNKEYDTKLIATDKTIDLALLKVKVKPKSYFAFSKDEPKKLQKIYVAGYPLGKGLSDDLKITTGIISALKGFEDNSNEIQVDAAINPGNSGGPIVNENGELVAIAVSGMKKAENINFGIKSSAATNFLKSNNINFNKSLYSRSKNKEQLLNILEEGTVYTYCN